MVGNSSSAESARYAAAPCALTRRGVALPHPQVEFPVFARGLPAAPARATEPRGYGPVFSPLTTIQPELPVLCPTVRKRVSPLLYVTPTFARPCQSGYSVPCPEIVKASVIRSGRRQQPS